MSMDAKGIFAALTSKMKRMGVFESVNGFEVKNAPTNGLTLELWLGDISNAPLASGQADTAARLMLTLRINRAIPEHSEVIELAMIDACDKLMTQFNGDFTLGGKVMEIDLLGAYGPMLAARGVYLDRQGTMFRAIEIVLPLIIDAAWTQGGMT